MKFGSPRDSLSSTLGVLLLVGCSSTAATNNNSSGGVANTAIGGAAGMNTGGTATGMSGATGALGGTTGIQGNGGGGGTSNGGTGTGGVTANGGTAGVAVGGSGGVAVGGASGAAAGGTGGAAGSASGGGGGDVGVVVPTGPSAGCNKPPPAQDTEGDFSLHEITLTATIPAHYLVGGGEYDSSGNYDFQHRPYSIRLPNGYNPAMSYPVIMAGGGCGGNASNFAGNPGSGYDIDQNREAIFVGLSYVAGCFADGGGSTNDMADTPEVPYVHEVLAEVKANYCVDQSRVFMTGTSSGGWESITVGCALSNEVRGIAPVSGGLRLHRPACTGPQASIFVEGLSDGANPIFEDPPNGSRDSPGSGPARDEILIRNGCVPPTYTNTIPLPYNTLEQTAGTAAHTAWDAAFPECVSYTGCPPEFPVVWCALPCGHQCDNEGGRDYKDAMMKFFTALTTK